MKHNRRLTLCVTDGDQAAPGRCRRIAVKPGAMRPIVVARDALTWFAALAGIAFAALTAFADVLEPPPDAPAGEDYVYATTDSLGDGDVEVGLGYSATAGSRAVRTRRARFRSDSLAGEVRDGAGDDLAGSALEGAIGRGQFGLGRAAPVWGRGLVFGEPVEPWSRRSRPRSSARRRADGDVAWYRLGHERLRLGALCGNFAGRAQGGMELGSGDLGVGVAGDANGVARSTVWWAPRAGADARGAELAFDRDRRWRLEAATGAHAGKATIAAWLRAGLAGLRPIGDPRRAGPAQALSVSAHMPLAAMSNPQDARHLAFTASAPRHASRLIAVAALWRFGSGANGARGMLEVEHALPHDAAVVLGVEEQHGTRRDPLFAASRAQAEAREFRQGAWGEWRAWSGPVELGWRHERWGARAPVRDAVRAVTTARLGARSARGFGARITHAVFRARRGEHVYLPEAQADRLVLRALAGDGERMRLEIELPFAGGRAQATLNRTTTAAKSPRMQWTLEWIRRSRVKRGR